MCSKLNRLFICWLLLVVGALCTSPALAKDTTYNPLSPGSPSNAKPVDLAVNDATRDREIPIRVYLPATSSPAPVVIFSHGLGGSREGSAFLGEHWSAHGYVVVFVQHHGSDSELWIHEAPENRMKALQKGMSIENFFLRVKDIPVVLDKIAKWNKTSGHALAGRLDLTKIGMSGHSFGAVTTQALSGQKTTSNIISFTDDRIKAALAMSPSVPSNGTDPKRVFDEVKIPWMLMTGTKDASPFGTSDPATRRRVYAALPATGNKYEVVLNNAEHSAFSDRKLPGDKEKRNPNHHRVILSLSTAFWDTWLRDDAAAKVWLNGDGPKMVLEKDDFWEHK